MLDIAAAQLARPLSGEKLYQERARRALPILVRQAEAKGQWISYSDLATELGMPNARNLNYVLESIGQTMENLSRHWGQRVPPIQCLVMNKYTHLPGDGFEWSLIEKEDFASLTPVRKRAIVDAELMRIYGYTHWREVLQILGLSPLAQSYAELNRAAAGRGGGESEAHRRMKEYVAAHPEIVDLPRSTERGICEYPLPSGDKLDISFFTKSGWIAVEVKSEISTEDDILRGLYQCVKYVAVMQAVEVSEKREMGAQAFLAIAGRLPNNLLPLKNMFGIKVIENVPSR